MSRLFCSASKVKYRTSGKVKDTTLSVGRDRRRCPRLQRSILATMAASGRHRCLKYSAQRSGYFSSFGFFFLCDVTGLKHDNWLPRIRSYLLSLYLAYVSATSPTLSLALQLSSSSIQNEERRRTVPLLRTTRSAGFKCAVGVCRLWCDSRRCLCRRGRGARRGVSSTWIRTLTGYRGPAWNTGIPTTLHVDSPRLPVHTVPSDIYLYNYI